METICPDQKSSTRRRVASAGGAPIPSLTLPASGIHFPVTSLSLTASDCRVDDFEARLHCFETAAKEKLSEAIAALPDVKLEDWFIRLLDNHIIPNLTRIGFDASFARTLFHIAAAGWQQMGPASDKCICFLPVLTRSLRMIRNEMTSKAGHPPDGFSRGTGTACRDHPQITKSNAGANVSSSWIILPRAYRFLEQPQSRYLLGYLRRLEWEPQLELRKILARIIIEFAGNYTSKYRSRSFSRCRVDAALFYGYAAMFWKNLRRPPEGFEDDLIFSHFLRFIRLFQSRCSPLACDIAETLKQMESHRQQVLPDWVALRPANPDLRDCSRLIITLRHGHPGMSAAIACLGTGIRSVPEKPTDRSFCVCLPKTLNELFQTIKKRLPQETPAFQNLIRKFLGRLKENYTSAYVDDERTAGDSAAQWQFFVRRVIGLIDGLSASLV